MSLRSLIEYAAAEITIENQGESPGDRSRGQTEQIGRRQTILKELLALSNSEAMLFIDYQ